MTRLLPVVRREYLERVRSKVFLVGTFLGPAIMAALMLVPSLVIARQRGKPLQLAVVDASGRLQRTVETAVARHRSAQGANRFVIVPPGEGASEERRERLKAAVLREELDGFVYLAADALETSSAEYYGRNVSNMMDLQLLNRALRDALVDYRLTQAGLGPEEIGKVTRWLELKTIRISATGEREDRGGTFFLSLILLMMLYTTLALWGAALMNGVIEEKTSRVVEVVVSSISAGELLAGKLLGVGAAGLTQFLVWVTFLAGVAAFGSQAALVSGFQMPEVSTTVLVFFVVFFLLGYFLYGVLYAAVGAAVNSAQEAQTLIFPVISPLVVGVMLFPAVLARPDGALAVALSLIPFWTPLLMFLRMTASTPPAWQVALSILLTLATIAGTNWVAARVYRVGILMYGKRPTFPEILKWIGRA